MPFNTLEEGLTRLRSQIYAELSAEASPLYIPLLGKRFALEEARTSDLETSVRNFLNPSEKPVLVLYGDAGSGKSVFLKKLTLSLWESYDQGKPIPLFIELPKLKNPVHQAIEETLSGCRAYR